MTHDKKVAVTQTLMEVTNPNKQVKKSSKRRLAKDPDNETSTKSQ